MNVSLNRHVALILPDLRFGGAQRVMLELARRFLADGIRVDIVNLTGTGELVSEVPAEARYVALARTTNDSRVALALGSVGRLRRFLRRESPSAVLSTMTGTNLVTVIAARSVGFRGRLVVREAASTLNTSSLMNWLVRLLYRRADHVITVSNGVADDMKTLGLADTHLTTIPNPIDADRVRSLSQAEIVSSPRPYLIAVGRLTQQKDHVTLLRAFAACNARSTYDLTIVGKGPEQARLSGLVNELGLIGQVRFVGALQNPYPSIASAGLLVLSSRWEGYPNVLLEALALGVPVVSTDCVAGPAELLSDGRFGRLARVGDAAGLARAIDDELARPSTGQGEVISRHAPTFIASRYAAVLGIGA